MTLFYHGHVVGVRCQSAIVINGLAAFPLLSAPSLVSLYCRMRLHVDGVTKFFRFQLHSCCILHLDHVHMILYLRSQRLVLLVNSSDRCHCFWTHHRLESHWMWVWLLCVSMEKCRLGIVSTCVLRALSCQLAISVQDSRRLSHELVMWPDHFARISRKTVMCSIFNIQAFAQVVKVNRRFWHNGLRFRVSSSWWNKLGPTETRRVAFTLQIGLSGCVAIVVV